MRYSIIGISPLEAVALGGRDIKEARHSKVVFATLTEAQAKHVASLGYKVRGEKKVRADTTTVITPPTPIEAVPRYTPQQLMYVAGLEELRGITDPPLYGEGFNIAILDTGIRETHQQIVGRIIYRKNYTTDPMRDQFDHGTGVASVAAAVAPECGILNMKVLDDDGNGTDENVILAIDDCIDLLESDLSIAPCVINMSLGAEDDGDPDDPFRVACRTAIEHGIWIVAAAGNGGPALHSVTSPACERYVAAVGSARYLPAESTFIVSDFSARGPTKEGLIKPDLVLFGEDLMVASSAGDTAVIAKAGTSFSCSFAAAMGLLYHEGVIKYGAGIVFTNGSKALVIDPLIAWMVSEEQVLDVYLNDICIKPDGVAAGKDHEYGYGLPFGPYIAQEITPGVDISPMLTGVVVIGMMGMMMKVMR